MSHFVPKSAEFSALHSADDIRPPEGLRRTGPIAADLGGVATDGTGHWSETPSASGVVRPTLRRRLHDPTVGSDPWLAGDRVWQPGAGRQGQGQHHEHQSQFLCRAHGLCGGRFPSLTHATVFPHQRRSSHQAMRVNSHRPAVAVVTRFPDSSTRLHRQMVVRDARGAAPVRLFSAAWPGLPGVRRTCLPHGRGWRPPLGLVGPAGDVVEGHWTESLKGAF
jgi:hypothetical protein